MTPLPRDAFPHAVATPRLRLRKPERGDDGLLAGLIFEAYASRPDPLSQDRAVEFGSFAIEHWERYGFGFLVLEIAETTGSPLAIGHAGFKYADTWPGHWGEDLEAVELGYAIVPSARGCGYATEAARAVLSAAFAAFGVPRIGARCSHENPKSADVLVRCGMREIEPTERQRRFELARPE